MAYSLLNVLVNQPWLMNDSNWHMETAFSDPSAMLSCLNSFCPLERDDILNEFLQEKPNSSYRCPCDDVAIATSRCKECNEILCDNCVRAHLRVKLTKEHCIVPLDEPRLSPSSSLYSTSSNVTSQGSPSSLLNGNGYTTCDLHLTETVRMYCDNCNMIFCQECNSTEHRNHSCVSIQDAIDCARTSSQKLLSDVKMSAHSAKECLDLTQKMLETINLRSQAITREIRNIMHHFRFAIEERERELVCKVETIRLVKYKAIQQHIEGYRTLFSCFTQSSKVLSDALDLGGPLELLQIRDSVSAEMKRLLSIRSNMPHVDDYMSVTPPDGSLLLAISSLIDVTTTGFTPSPIGEEMAKNNGKPFLHNRRNSYFHDFSNNLETTIPSIPTQENLCNGLYSFPLWIPGNYIDNSCYKGPKDNPCLVLKDPRLRNNSIGSAWRNYTLISEPLLIIGEEGEKDGQLCRPWGVTCTAEGNIVVADRSNNRIQIFKPDGTFLRKFGSHGTEPGQFDRPAGVAVDPHGRIIVTDKDNHRVQVFTPEGIFIFTFGEKGSKVSQFNYPWDLAVDFQGRIVVSDTRNHRIQMFDNEGKFLAKYGFDNTSNMVKHFDSPRGVCFGAGGCVIVTDFNNHRLVVVNPNLDGGRFLGAEGCGEKQFLRPQGLVVDPAGNIIVADSRNNRIQIFEPEGKFIWEFGSAGKEPGKMDRPSGICLSPDGKIIVVDFGNNRLQVF